MEGLAKELLTMIVGSASPALMALLLLVCGGLAWFTWKRESEHKKERDLLVDKLQKQGEEDKQSLLKVLDKYQDSQVQLIQAINDLKVLIASLGAKL